MYRTDEYDLVVIGTGPAGTAAALEAARLGVRVAAVERKECIAGFSIHKGTITSKMLRAAILNLRTGSGEGPGPPRTRFRMQDLRETVEAVCSHESQSVIWKMGRNGVMLVYGQGTFVDPHTLLVTSPFDTKALKAKMFVLAPGSGPSRPENIPFDGRTVLDSEEIMQMDAIPESVIVVGGGIIGIEYANMFAALGVETTLVDRHEEVLGFADREIVNILLDALRDLGVRIMLGSNVEGGMKKPTGEHELHVSGGRTISARMVLVCSGRRGNTHTLNLKKAGVQVDECGFIQHDGSFRTHAPHIYAAGDVVAFPALASTAMKQGREVVHRLLDTPETFQIQHIPYALYTIPEVSMVGATEEDLVRDGVPYQVGRARFYDTVMGDILKDNHGMLKILFQPDTLKLLGVHAIGHSAAEIIHVGHAVMELGGTLDYFKETVFNYPTLAECYRLAALNGLKKVASNMPKASDANT